MQEIKVLLLGSPKFLVDGVDKTTSHSLGSLRNALSAVNKIGDIIQSDGQNVQIAPGADISTDVADFVGIVSGLAISDDSGDGMTQTQAESAERAVRLHRDDLLKGYSVNGSAEFDHRLMSISDRLQQDLGLLLEPAGGAPRRFIGQGGGALPAFPGHRRF